MLVELLLNQQFTTYETMHSIAVGQLRTEIQRLEFKVQEFESKAKYFEQLYNHEKLLNEKR